MISAQEEKFYLQWEKDRLLPHYKRKPFLRGLSIGLALGIISMIITESGWYERANMVANIRGNEIWILLSIVVISVGIAFFYQQFSFEMNEQRYQELKYIKSKK